jgi:hypothetical protein
LAIWEKEGRCGTPRGKPLNQGYKYFDQACLFRTILKVGMRTACMFPVDVMGRRWHDTDGCAVCVARCRLRLSAVFSEPVSSRFHSNVILAFVHG